jgi:hypothetical protein
MAIALLVAIGVLFVSVGTSLLAVFDAGNADKNPNAELLIVVLLPYMCIYSIIRKRLLVSGQYLDVTLKSTTCPEYNGDKH